MLPKITHPTFSITIPSSGKKTSFRPMLVREEKILLIAKQSEDKADTLNAVKQIVANCLVDEKFDINRSPVFDVEYMFLKIRAASISNKTNVSYKDNEDEKIYDFEVDLDKITVKKPENVDNKISVSADMILELRWPTMEVFAVNKDSMEADQVFDLFVMNCMDKLHHGDKAIDITSASEEEKKEFINNLPAKAAEQIRDFFGNTPTLYHEINYTNSKGTERKIVLSSLDDFFTL